MGGHATRAGFYGNSRPVLIGAGEKLGADSFDPSPSLVARLGDTFEDGMGADTDPMLVEQALPLVLPGSGVQRDSTGSDDLLPADDACGGAPGFLGKFLCEDPSLFVGSLCGRTLDRDGPSFLM